MTASVIRNSNNSSLITVDFQKFQIPYSFISPNLFEFSGPRTPVDTHCARYNRLLFFRRNRLGEIRIFFLFSFPIKDGFWRHWEKIRKLLWEFYLPELAVFVWADFYFLCLFVWGGGKQIVNDSEVPLLEKGENNYFPDSKRETFAKTITITFIISVALTWIFIIAFFVIYFSFVSSIELESTFNSVGWKFAISIPFILLAFFMISVLIIFNCIYFLVEKMVKISQNFFADLPRFFVVFILAFANLDLLEI